MIETLGEVRGECLKLSEIRGCSGLREGELQVPSKSMQLMLSCSEIDSIRVLGVRDFDVEIELTVDTTTDRDWCRTCGVRARSKGRATVIVRDLTGFATV